ncbi:F-box domain protein [Kalmanozyma brasiliensis GHG001]|uniref:F-box domain-containing protein n=1 Tax=Kalmanozyma brasiliensis (strain GHG001) TaxID=1365824 RepID=V5EIK3_KALBG|nr:F-box domain protein [Kalmanozyma brasiliensis GHG001]EST04505.1 F-box domain protein [Kalmanozyma brasiliensis GHG001]
MSALSMARSASAGHSLASASTSVSTPASSHPSSASSHVNVDLPNELLRHIFLYCDPATLYTGVRALNKSWKHTVEHDLIGIHFANRDWRVGLRVTRKLPSTLTEEEVADAQRQQTDEDLYRLNVLNRAGAREPFNINAKPRTVTHVIPLAFKGYDEDNVSLRFDTDSTWHSLFQVSPPESDEEGAAQNNAAPAAGNDDGSDDSGSSDEEDETETQAANGGAPSPANAGRQRREDFGAAAARARARAESARLELDFGLVWRFPDDGQDADVYQIKKGDAESWGQPDPENGWLSRFYCSNFDTVSSATTSSAPSAAPSGTASPAMLQSTPLTRRSRSSRLHSAVERRMHDVVDDDEDEGFSPAQMIWSDEGHEYMSLDLLLGMEFFVRRSARANQLVRRLEAAAAAADARDVVAQLTRKLKKGKKSARRSGLSSLNPSAAGSVAGSGYATPLEMASPPPSRMTAATDPRRRAMQNALSKEAHRGSSTSRLASGSSPLKGKEAAKDDDDDSADENEGFKTPDQPASAPTFLAPSMMPSRFNSVAPSRQGGGSVGTASSYGTKSRAGNGSRAGGSSAPRATFQAKLLRAERMPSRPSTPPPAGEEESSDSATANTTPSDRAGWTGGDKFGRGAYRLAQEWSEELESDKFQEALSNSGVTTPVTWTWSR